MRDFYANVLSLALAAWAITSTRAATTASPVVDLGYAAYRGYYNTTSALNIFKGIRYAAPPTGQLRWKKPQLPAENRSEVLSATSYPPKCPQSDSSPEPTGYAFEGDEDCLFLSVFADPSAHQLPVMVWIHGGGYGTGQGNNEFWELLSTNKNGFILVLIQYRLGAFGFLSSADLVSQGGIPNAGIHDMRFALQWVQSHVEKFGGDPNHVTISGESAGGGAVMLLGMAHGGSEGTGLFTNAITASPYLPTQYEYDGSEPTWAYDQFAAAAGCGSGGRRMAHSSVLACLVAADTTTLQNASDQVSGREYKYGQWAFVPVTDMDLITQRPSAQLNTGQVNGLRMLTSNNADEAVGFVPQNISSASDFEEFAAALFPKMSKETLDQLYSAYSIAPVLPGPIFSTLGDTGPTALNQSEFAIGQQQRANNLYAETTFMCPSYWLANAYSPSPQQPNKMSWKYQFSVPPSEHGADLDAYQSSTREALGEGTMTDAARKAVQMAWGRFIINDNPTLPQSLIKQLTTTANGTRTADNLSAIATGNWPQWSAGTQRMLNINMTGGVPDMISWTPLVGKTVNVTQMIGPGLEARFRTVDAWSWEGGRGARCELWKKLGSSVPER